MNSGVLDNKGKDGAKPSDDEMRDALARVVASDAFASAPRLQQFLSYVVEETIAGRGGAIVGKAIAVDVYGRRLEGDSGQNLVRVEARRLRRRLDEYYAGIGTDDPWQIRIEVGGYSPRFESSATAVPSSHEVPKHTTRTRVATKVILVAALVLIAALAIGVALDSGVDEQGSNVGNSEASRAAYRERSMQALQAVNFAEQARGMLFPVFDLKRQEIALEMFRHAISLDPGLYHGYAGAAQVLATLALLSPDESRAADHEKAATEMVMKALDIAPSDAWPQAAQGWVLAVSGDLERAYAFAQRAVNLAPQDGHILDLAGTIAIITNHPEFAEEVSSPDRPRSGTGRFGANNIWGVAQLMLGHYDEVIEAFAGAPESGAPVSAPSLIFLAIAYDHTGNEQNAGRIAAELSASWPDFPINHIVARMFRNAPKTGDDILERLAKYGYPGSAIRQD